MYITDILPHGVGSFRTNQLTELSLLLYTYVKYIDIVCSRR